MQSEVANIIGVSEESIWNRKNDRTKLSKKNLKIINAFVTASLNYPAASCGELNPERLNSQ